MEQYINKSAVVAEIEELIKNGKLKCQQSQENNDQESYIAWSEHIATCGKILSFLNNLGTKEVDLESEQRMNECPFRQVGCTMYEGYVLECTGACSWVVDYPNLKDLIARKG